MSRDWFDWVCRWQVQAHKRGEKVDQFNVSWDLFHAIVAEAHPNMTCCQALTIMGPYGPIMIHPYKQP